MLYSPTLSFLMSRLEGFSTNSYKLQVLGSSTANSGQILRFELPANAIVDLSKFALAFNCVVSGAEMTRLTSPHNLIERISVTVGGIELQSGFNKLAKNMLTGLGMHAIISLRTGFLSWANRSPILLIPAKWEASKFLSLCHRLSPALPSVRLPAL